MSGTESKELSEKEQLLLSSYVDNECSLLSRWRAERLLKNNSNAQTFIRHLQQTSQTFRTYAPSYDSSSVDLWARVSNRIDAEERAALYLGERKAAVEDSSPSFASRFLSRHAVIGGFSGAAVAAMALVLIYRPSKPGEILPVYAGSSVAVSPASPYQQASLGREQQVSLPRSTMEVDWMRGNGSLRLIQNPTGKSAIIWVRKRNVGAALQNQRAYPTPTLHAVLQQGLDVKPLGISK